MRRRVSATFNGVQIETETGEGRKEEMEEANGTEMIVGGLPAVNEVIVETMVQAYAYRMLDGSQRQELALVQVKMVVGGRRATEGGMHQHLVLHELRVLTVMGRSV